MKRSKAIFGKPRLGILLIIVVCVALESCVKVDSFTPPGGNLNSNAQIEIIGKGFSPDTSKNGVTIGGVPVKRVISASEETLLVVLPDTFARGRIEVSRPWRFKGMSKTDFLLLPDYLQYRKFESATLDIEQGYWIMYPPSFAVASERFPIIYALHGYNGPLRDLFDFQGNEHQLIFELAGSGMYFPFVAYCLMKSSSVDELREELQSQLAKVAGEVERNHVDEVVASILYYLPENADSWLPNLTEMIMVFPDGDNGWYTDRLGPPDGRNEEGLGEEPSFPTSRAESPAGRLDLHVTGWYESYMVKDAIKEVEEPLIGLDKLDTLRFIMGISMGGYGSLKLALKYQTKFTAAASLSGNPFMTAKTTADLKFYNQFSPELLDIFGSAPLARAATREELEANVHLDEAYLAVNSPMQLVESLDEIDLHFFVEIGEKDIAESFMPGAIAAVQEFIDRLREKGVPVAGGIVPAASEDEPGNGGANHVSGFFRTRLGAILKFFSAVYEQRTDSLNKTIQ